MNNIVIIGSSGHAKVVIDIVRQEGGFNIVGLLDRFRNLGEETLGYPIIGTEEDLPHLVNSHSLKGVIIAIGDNFIRSKVAERIKEICPDLLFIPAIHPSARIATEVSIGEGTIVMAGVSINPCSSIGRFCILNTHSGNGGFFKSCSSCGHWGQLPDREVFGDKYRGNSDSWRPNWRAIRRRSRLSRDPND